jgi:hypothetical protein
VHEAQREVADQKTYADEVVKIYYLRKRNARCYDAINQPAARGRGGVGTGLRMNPAAASAEDAPPQLKCPQCLSIRGLHPPKCLYCKSSLAPDPESTFAPLQVKVQDGIWEMTTSNSRVEWLFITSKGERLNQADSHLMQRRFEVNTADFFRRPENPSNLNIHEDAECACDYLNDKQMEEAERAPAAAATGADQGSDSDSDSSSSISNAKVTTPAKVTQGSFSPFVAQAMEVMAQARQFPNIDLENSDDDQDMEALKQGIEASLKPSAPSDEADPDPNASSSQGRAASDPGTRRPMEPIRFVKASAATGAEEPSTKEQMEATHLLAGIKPTFSSGATMHNILLNKMQEDKTEG